MSLHLVCLCNHENTEDRTTSPKISMPVLLRSTCNCNLRDAWNKPDKATCLHSRCSLVHLAAKLRNCRSPCQLGTSTRRKWLGQFSQRISDSQRRKLSSSMTKGFVCLGFACLAWVGAVVAEIALHRCAGRLPTLAQPARHRA